MDKSAIDDSKYVELGMKIEGSSVKQVHSQVTTIEYIEKFKHFKVTMLVEVAIHLANGIKLSISTDISMTDTNKEVAISNCLLAVGRAFTKDLSYYKKLVTVYLDEYHKYLIDNGGSEDSLPTLEDLFDANTSPG